MHRAIILATFMTSGDLDLDPDLRPHQNLLKPLGEI